MNPFLCFLIWLLPDCICNIIAPSGPPSSFYANSTDSRTIFLSWSPPAFYIQNGIIRYYVVTLTSNLPTVMQNVSSNQFSIRVSNLRPNTVYGCSISAVTIGTGPKTFVQFITTPEDGKLMAQLGNCKYCAYSLLYAINTFFNLRKWSLSYFSRDINRNLFIL